MAREGHRPRLCETCQAQMAPQEETCRRCGAVWMTRAAKPHDDGSSLRERTAQVLDTRARRHASRAQRGRHAADE
jgi:ribosomal protein L40E